MDRIVNLLKRPAARASLDVTFFHFLQKAVQLGGNIFLARLLAPSIFGEMVIINTLIIGLSLLSDVGIAQAIIRHPDDKDRSFVWTMWSVQILRGGALYLFICLLSFPASKFYHHPELSLLLPAAGLVLVIQGFRSTAEPLAYRNFKIRSLLLGKVVTQTSNILVSAGVAWGLSSSVWALIAGLVFSALVDIACSHILLDRYKHRFFLDKKHLQAFFRFGRWIFFSTAISFIAGQGTPLIQGLYVDSATLGLIGISGVLAWFFGELITKGLDGVGYPLLTKSFKASHDQFCRQLNVLQVYIVGLGGGLFFGMALFSNLIIAVLYDARYAPAGEYLLIAAVGGAFTVYPMCLSKALQASGKVNVDFYLNLVFAVLRVVVIATSLKFLGAVEMLWGLTATHALRHGVSLLLQYRVVGTVRLASWLIYVALLAVACLFYLF